MKLQWIDWIIVVASLLICLVPALFFGKRASKDTMATTGWIAGCALIGSSLFCIGNFLYGRTSAAWILLGVAVVSGGVLLYIVNHLWDKNNQPGDR